MITKIKGGKGFEITCDSCSIEFLEVPVETFKEAIVAMKREGWTVYKNENNDWVHNCVDCGVR